MSFTPPNRSGRLLLAIAALPPRQDALAQVASIAGLTLADVRLRLTGTLPRVLLSDTQQERVHALAAALEEHEVSTLVCDPAAAPSDAERIVARQLELSADGFVVIDRAHNQTPVAPASITLLQRGFRTSTQSEVVTTSERKVALGRAVLSGGLLMTKEVKKSAVRASESRETLLLVQRWEPEPAIILYERQLNYRFLGAELQPAAYSNLVQTMKRIRALAPHAPLDERVGQPGFMQKLAPLAAGDPTDLALYLIQLAHLRHC